ncbi:MAG: glutathione-disulfide reductase [Pseudomonadales bacterium]|nr:glutathione-disulfide reductase [Pseudomonadales bacterium]
MSTTDYDFDFFVIGAGSGGVRASRIAAALGARVGVAEERFLGGTCVNVGCVPKKLFSYAAHYHHDFADSQGFGWSFPQQPVLDWSILKENKDKEIKRLNGIYRKLLENAGVTLFENRATVRGPHSIQLGEQQITSRHILIATGGRPFIPDIPGSEMVMNSDDVFALESLPKSILIVGGGYIAVEFAGIFAGLGVETTLVNRGPTLLRGFDQDIQSNLLEEFKKYSRLKLECKVESITGSGQDLKVNFTDGSSQATNAVLYATGRLPNTTNLGLESAEVKLAKNGAVIVDEHFQTSCPSVFAVGDVIDRIALTPVALAEGEILARRLFADNQTEMNYENIATAVFSQPNIATVGLTEEQARSKYDSIKVYKSRFTPLKHTLSGNSEKTFLKMLVESDSDRVLGIHMMGPDAGEIIQGLAVAMVAGASKKHFDQTIGIHPTTAEEFVTLRTPEPG